MIHVAGHMGLEDAGPGRLLQFAATVDKTLRDMADFRDVEVTGNGSAIREDETRMPIRIRSEDARQFMQFHCPIYIPLHAYSQGAS